MSYLLRPLVLLALAGALAAVSFAAAAKPNIVFIIADDLGYADVAFHGGNVPTPHLDRLMREGVELTHSYVAATCSPTRAGLMTGRVWSRFGLVGPDNRRALPWNTVTLPRALKAVGYETALMGKWHLGSKPEWGPNHYGFDHSYGSLAGGVGAYDHLYKRGEFSVTWHRNEKLITETGHVTDLITNEAEQWIARRGDTPFFLYLPYTAVHLPIKEPQVWLDRVPATIKGDVARHYAACVMHLDDAVGRVVAALEKAGKRQNTLIVFTSDNGGSKAGNSDQDYPPDNCPVGKLPGNNDPLRGNKGDLYEGGIRVVGIANWPGGLKPGKFSQPLHVTDWMPTLCALTGYKTERDLRWDGTNAWPQISGKSQEKLTRTMYWVTPQGSAVREGDWKLIVAGGRSKTPGKVELFNVARDPNETTELAKQHPDKVEQLKTRLASIAKSDRDAMAED